MEPKVRIEKSKYKTKYRRNNVNLMYIIEKKTKHSCSTLRHV
jgi:hypothetical protein